MGGNGDYEAGDESIGQVCEGPYELCYTFILIAEGSYYRVLNWGQGLRLAQICILGNSRGGEEYELQ